MDDEFTITGPVAEELRGEEIGSDHVLEVLAELVRVDLGGYDGKQPSAVTFKVASVRHQATSALSVKDQVLEEHGLVDGGNRVLPAPG